MGRKFVLHTALICVISIFISGISPAYVYASDVIRFVDEEKPKGTGIEITKDKPVEGTDADDVTIDLTAPGSVDIENDEEQIDYIIEKVHEVVERYRAMSPYWEDLLNGTREHCIPEHWEPNM